MNTETCLHSLDTLINDADASEVLKAVLDMGAALAGRARRAVHLQSRRRQLYRRRTGG